MIKWPFFLVLIACVPPPEAVKVRAFGGWIAGCDNENVCTAIRTVDAVDGVLADGRAPFLQLTHHPYRDSIPEFRLFDPANPAPDGVLRPEIARLTIRYGLREADEIRIFYALPDFNSGTRFNQKGGYRFRDEDAWSILYGLRVGALITMSIGSKQVPLGNADFAKVLAFFDRQQDLAITPGALALRPGNIMFDYVHPRPPVADTVMLSAFGKAQLDRWFKDYLEQHPGVKVKHAEDPQGGLVTTIRYMSFEFDCGTFERWGHVGTGDEFVMVERREMPVCSGIPESHWVRSYRADTISPE